MATLTADRLTLAELAKRMKDRRIQPIAENLAQTNAILRQAVWQQANGETSHTTVERTSYPSGTIRKINEGITQEASHTKQIVESICMLEAMSRIDEALVDLSGDPVQYRLTEDLAFLEGLNQTFASDLFYSTQSGSPEKIKGLATRLSSIGANSGATNCWDSGGTSSTMASIWLVQWGPQKVTLCYPKSSMTAGIQHIDDGIQTVLDSDGNPYKAYQSHFKMHWGLVVENNKCVQRIANIDCASGAASTATMIDNIIRASRYMPDEGAGAVLYANKDVMIHLDVQAKDKTNVSYVMNEEYGRPILHVRGIPVEKCDALTTAESQLT